METEVLIRAVISADGTTVRVAPGVEVKPQAVDIVTDVPDGMGDYSTLMFFATEADRQEFAQAFQEAGDVALREI